MPDLVVGRHRAIEMDAAFVLYRYSRNARAPWPEAPAGTAGPLTEVRGGPHELAAYASAGIAEAVLDTCAALGWALAQRIVVTLLIAGRAYRPVSWCTRSARAL